MLMQSHVCTEAPATLSRNQKASANRAVLTLWPLTNLFWHKGVLGLKNQNEKEVFYHLSVIAGWTCPYTQPLPRVHCWKGVSDKHQNDPLVMSSGRALCSHWTMAEASSGSPAAQGFGQQTAAGAQRWKLGLGPAGDPTLHSSTLPSSCFVSYSCRQAEFRKPPASQTAEPSSMRKLCLLTSLPGLGKGNINGHFTSLLHISVLFPVLYFIVKARLILLFDGTWVTNSAYPVGFSGRENIIGIFFSTQ